MVCYVCGMVCVCVVWCVWYGDCAVVCGMVFVWWGDYGVVCGVVWCGDSSVRVMW